MRIYTRTDDTRETRLFDGTRAAMSDARVDAYGEVDELNSGLGVVSAAGVDSRIGEMLARLQRVLFALGSRLANPRLSARAGFVE